MGNVLARGIGAAMAKAAVFEVDALDRIGERAGWKDVIGGNGRAHIVGDVGGLSRGVERDVAGACSGGG